MCTKTHIRNNKNECKQLVQSIIYKNWEHQAKRALAKTPNVSSNARARPGQVQPQKNPTDAPCEDENACTHNVIGQLFWFRFADKKKRRKYKK